MYFMLHSSNLAHVHLLLYDSNLAHVHFKSGLVDVQIAAGFTFPLAMSFAAWHLLLAQLVT